MEAVHADISSAEPRKSPIQDSCYFNFTRATTDIFFFYMWLYCLLNYSGNTTSYLMIIIYIGFGSYFSVVILLYYSFANSASTRIFT
jgi:hypothetical protein